jgi:hypothetical protein
MLDAERIERPTLSRPLLNDPVEQLLGPGLQVEPNVLVRFVTRHRRDALHEIEDTLGLMPLFRQHGLDDFRRLGFAEATLA